MSDVNSHLKKAAAHLEAAHNHPEEDTGVKYVPMELRQPSQPDTEPSQAWVAGAVVSLVRAGSSTWGFLSLATLCALVAYLAQLYWSR